MSVKYDITDVCKGYYKDRTVLVTGHTGFKGSWLCAMLELAGAKVIGYALPPQEGDNLFTLFGVAQGCIRSRAMCVIWSICGRCLKNITRR